MYCIELSSWLLRMTASELPEQIPARKILKMPTPKQMKEHQTPSSGEQPSRSAPAVHSTDPHTADYGKISKWLNLADEVLATNRRTRKKA